MRFTGSVGLRPVRIGFLTPPDDLNLVSRVANLNACLWGGRYNPIIPCFETNDERWVSPYDREGGLRVAQGYIDFFEPDVIVEAQAGMADRLGWKGSTSSIGLPRVLTLDEFYTKDQYGHIEFAAGVDIIEVMQHLYIKEYQYERRHKRPFAKIDNCSRDAFFDVVGGRYPDDHDLGEISVGYSEVFAPNILPPTADTALKFITDGYAGPLWVTRHGLEETLGRGSHDATFYLFDATNAGDIINYWNFRLFAPNVIPINLQWFDQHKGFIRQRILEVYRPIPGNSFGTHFCTSLCFASSISNEAVEELISNHLTDLPTGSYYWRREAPIWHRIGRGHERPETKIVATASTIQFDEIVSPEGNAKIPAPAPAFINASGRHTRARWINLISPATSAYGDSAAIVYPSNLWSPDYPRHLARGENLRIGREGWAIPQQHSIGYLLLEPQEGREAIMGWLRNEGIDAFPSEEGQIAAQVIASAGSLLSCGMFANRETIELLSSMAESRADSTRAGQAVKTTTPDRSKHIDTVRQHFDAREKQSFGYWNELKFFIERSVFRAGLQVKCPNCAYQNWFDVDSFSYSPTCSRCLKQFVLPQTPQDLKGIGWYYRVIGPFAAPDYARGGYAVALTLRCLSGHWETEMTWATGLRLQSINCEVDFLAWHRAGGLSRGERDEPLLVIGEVKSFGKNAINSETIAGLKKAADRFPGAIMVVSSLRDISEYTEEELQRLRELALWGRLDTHLGQPRNPLIVLTGAELFSQHDIFEAWKKTGDAQHAFMRREDLYGLAELTTKRYLNLPGFWEERRKARDLSYQRTRLTRLIAAYDGQRR